MLHTRRWDVTSGRRSLQTTRALRGPFQSCGGDVLYCWFSCKLTFNLCPEWATKAVVIMLYCVCVWLNSWILEVFSSTLFNAVSRLVGVRMEEVREESLNAFQRVMVFSPSGVIEQWPPDLIVLSHHQLLARVPGMQIDRDAIRKSCHTCCEFKWNLVSCWLETLYQSCSQTVKNCMFSDHYLK